MLSIARRKPVSPEALRRHAADVALAARFDELLKRAQDTERVFREAQAAHASIADLHRLGKDLDRALTDVATTIGFTGARPRQRPPYARGPPRRNAC